MCTLYLAEVILYIYLHVVLSFGQDSLHEADIVNNCVNSTNSSSCIYTYEQLYNSLAKSENNFNISSALYPGRSRPSSVHVFVNVSGPNKTKDSKPAMYTWSMSCLYAAAPAAILEFLSLGSILVTPRTQNLSIQIPLFCCNVSENKERREKLIDERLTRVLAELQDLSVSPGIQDPTLNTAECVIQEHQPNIDATGLSSYIRAILWCSFLSVMLLGPIIAFASMKFFGNDPEKKDKFACCVPADDEDPCFICSYKHRCCNKLVRCYKKEDPFIRSAKYVCHFLLLTEILIIFVIICDLVNQSGFTCKNIPLEIYIFMPLMWVEGIVICIVQCRTNCAFCKEDKKTSIYRRYVFITSANVISYHFCWLIVGIMINPTWGLTVLAVVCFVSVALFLSVYAICDADKDSFCQRVCVFPVIFFGLCFVAALTVLAGQSFYGKDSADQIVKTALLYVVGGITWLFREVLPGNQNNQAMDPKNQDAHEDNEIEPPDFTINPSDQDESDSTPDPTSSRSYVQKDNEIELGEMEEEKHPFVPKA